MGWLWPGFLLLFGLIPVMLGVYIWMLKRRRRYAVRYSSLALVREAIPRTSRLRRHLPFAFFVLALASLILALGRPVSIVEIPYGRATVILAIDVSRSMCATDINPNRLEAAKEASLSFIRRQDPSTQIGIVAFAGYALLVQPPTNDLENLEAAVENLTVARRTAVGNAILKSLDAISEVHPDIPPSGDSTASIPSTGSGEKYAPAIVVLLTDGASNTGPMPLTAAEQAVERGIRVYTIGFGTANENAWLPDCDSGFQGDSQFGGERSGGGGFFGGGFRRGIDEETLQRIAAMTDGKYYSATSAGELQEVFRNLPTTLTTRQETTEISAFFAAAGALLALLAVGLSLLWHPLP